MEGKYYHTKDSVEEYIELAKDVDGGELIAKLKQVLTEGSSVLELGSGPGTDWRILSDTYEVIGSDNSTFFIDHLRRKNPDSEFIELDATTLNTDLKFDGIYSNKVLHHLNDSQLAMSIKRQAEALNKNGIICHSFWQGEGSEFFKGLFVNYQTKNSLSALLQNKFEIISIEEYQEFDASDSLLLLGRKK